MKLILLFFIPFLVHSYEIGDKVKSFKLLSHTGKSLDLNEYLGNKTIVLEWYNHGCPFVRKHYDSMNMQNLQKKYKTNDKVVWLSIISSNEGKQGFLKDSKEASERYNTEQMQADHLLLDFDGSVGRDFKAKTTPHMYIISKDSTLVYQGAIDSIRSPDPSDIKAATNYVDQALTEHLSDRKIKIAKTKAYGCSVKY